MFCFISVLFLLHVRGVAYSKLTPVLVSAVQELSMELHTLSKENQMLLDKVNQLEMKLEQQLSSSNDSKEESLMVTIKAMMQRIDTLEEKLASSS